MEEPTKEDIRAKEIADKITNYLNPMGTDLKAFNKAMSREHRTLQQNFTRLCLSWLENVASPDYGTDARNEQSKQIAQQIMASFTKEAEAKGYTGSSLELMSKPSGYLGHV